MNNLIDFSSFAKASSERFFVTMKFPKKSPEVGDEIIFSKLGVDMKGVVVAVKEQNFNDDCFDVQVHVLGEQ